MNDRGIEWRRGRVAGIAYEVTASEADSMSHPVVLIAGADTTGGAWPPLLVEALVRAGHVVLRFDHREVGDSAGAWPAYDLRSLADDVAAVIDDSVGSARVHLIGSSMGAMVAQLMAIDHRAESLTLVAASAGPAAGCSPPDDEYLERVAALAFSDDLAESDMARESARLLAGDRYPFRTPSADGPPPTTRHSFAVEATPPWHDRLADIDVPVLVIHGSRDPLFPADHGRFLAEAIPDAALVEVDGLGHEAPVALFEEFLPVLLDHLANAELSAR